MNDRPLIFTIKDGRMGTHRLPVSPALSNQREAPATLRSLEVATEVRNRCVL